MPKLLDIVGDDIARLKDDELRSLIGRLCEADYRSAGLPVNGIMWGGHQDARDGGLDVTVRDTVPPPNTSFVPRSITGFQVKKPEMRAAGILREMRPQGILRPSISALIADNGAYVIACSGTSATGTALQDRIDAMKNAVATEDNPERLRLDFLDRNRIATWVRCHTSLILWVRNMIGRPLEGWRPYGNWANPSAGVDEEYLVDDDVKLYDSGNRTSDGWPASEGLSQLREVLVKPGTSVRLVGLSGVGKTRFVQALFDTRLGEKALPHDKAIYTDTSDNPEPDPVSFANQLVNERSRAVLVVDNCSPDLHRRLTRACASEASLVSVLTVEYDVRDDLPEETTSIFRLGKSSDNLIEDLIRRRVPHLSQVDARRIAECSDGNARVALALADTVQRGDSLAGLRNEDLFGRLFWQRHAPDPSLSLSAQACSLVYSFQGTDVSSPRSELALLGALVGRTAEELYRDAAILSQRELVQSRGEWRAVLPHAIANKLAIQALAGIPRQKLITGFQSFSERLMKSFSRRLNYLHDSPAAVEIVEDWLTPKGWIGEHFHSLSEFGLAILRNIAPVAPEATLSAIEYAATGPKGDVFASRQNANYAAFTRLLRQLAYEPVLFERSVRLLIRFARTEDPNENNNSIRDLLRSLFYLYLSGTHAPPENRAAIIRELLDSEEEVDLSLGLVLLDAALEAWHFTGSYQYEFGARSRNFGYQPSTRGEVVHWFRLFIDTCLAAALSNRPVSDGARKVLADNLRGLWTKGGMFDEIEAAAARLLGQQPWRDGWVAVREIIRFDGKHFNDDTRKRLIALAERLKPRTLTEMARTFALSDRRASWGIEDDYDEDELPSIGFRRAAETTRRIGIEVARDAEALAQLLPEFVASSSNRLFEFGQGLAEGCNDQETMFQQLREAFENTPRDGRQIGIVLGFLSYTAAKDSAWFHDRLDALIDDEVFGEWLPIIETVSAIDRRGVDRINCALDRDIAPIQAFRHLAWGRANETITDDDLAEILCRILTKQGGIEVATDILHMRFHQSEAPPKYSDALIAAGRELLTAHQFCPRTPGQSGDDYELARIVEICLSGDDSATSARQLIENLANAFIAFRVYAFNYVKLLETLARLHPALFLDGFVGRKDIEQYPRDTLLPHHLERRGNPMNQIPDDVILAWCDEEPDTRYPLVAAVVDAFEQRKGISDDGITCAWNPIVGIILDRAPNIEHAMEGLVSQLSPSSWSGSLADILEARMELLQELCAHDNAEVVSIAKQQLEKFRRFISAEREREEIENRAGMDRFE